MCSLYSAFERLFYVWKERYINLVNNNNNNNNMKYHMEYAVNFYIWKQNGV